MDEGDASKIDLLRNAYAALNRGDFDQALAKGNPEFELVGSGIEAPVKGLAAMRQWMEPDAFEEQRYEPRQFEVSGNKVLVRQHLFARGAGSGIELDIETWMVWTFDDDGLLLRAQVYALDEEDEARRAAASG
jgi:ketosteroid isomerase-like protein